MAYQTRCYRAGLPPCPGCRVRCILPRAGGRRANAPAGGNAMTLPRRRFLRLAAAAAASPAMSRIARAQTYPARPVHLVVGFPPGQSGDISARLLGQWLGERLGQAFVIDNRPGAASTIATEQVVHAPPDGYTLLYIVAS